MSRKRMKKFDKILCAEKPVLLIMPTDLQPCDVVHVEIRKNTANGTEEAPQVRAPIKGKVHKPKGCATSTSQAATKVRAPPIAKVKVQLQQHHSETYNEGPCPFRAAKSRSPPIKGNVQQKLQSNAGKQYSSSNSSENEAYIPLDYYPLPDDATNASMMKNKKKKPRKRFRIRNKKYTGVVDMALEAIAQMVTRLLYAKGTAGWDADSEAAISAAVNELVLSENLPARIAAAIAHKAGRSTAEGAGFVEVAVVNNLQAAAQAAIKLHAAGVAANKCASKGAAAKKLHAEGALPGGGVGAHQIYATPNAPIKKLLAKRQAAAKKEEPLPLLSEVSKKVEKICVLAEGFFAEYGVANSLDPIEGFHVQSFLDELKALSAPGIAEELAQHHAGIDEIMSLLKNLNDLTKIVNDNEQAASGTGVANKNVATEGGAGMWVPVSVPNICAAKNAEKCRLLAAAEMEKEKKQGHATDGFNKQSFYAELAAQEEAKARLNHIVFMPKDPQMMADLTKVVSDVEVLSDSFAGLFLGSLDPIQSFLAEQQEAEQKPKNEHWDKKMKSMATDLNDLDELVNDAIDGYRALQLTAEDMHQFAEAAAEAGKGTKQNGPGVSDGDILDPMPEIQSPLAEQKARIVALEGEIRNAEQRPGPNGQMSMPNGPPEMNELAKKATDDGNEVSFFDTTDDDGQSKEWYENGEKVIGFYWPMIVGGHFV